MKMVTTFLMKMEIKLNILLNMKTTKNPFISTMKGHLDTEDRHLVIKDGVNSNHAISLQQLINSHDYIMKPYITTKI